MPPTETQLLRLSLKAHEAASDPDQWPEFLKQFAGAVDADAAFVQRHDFADGRSEYIATFGITSQLRATYHQYYSSINVWREQGRRLYVQGRTFVDEDAYPRGLLKRSEFYNDCLLLHRLTRCMAGVVRRFSNDALVLTAMREETGESFGKEERQTLDFLLPHVTRAATARERLDVLVAGEAMLDTLVFGVVLLARDKRVVFVNRAAEEIFCEADGVALRQARIVANGADDDAALQRLIEYSVSPGMTLECPPDVLLTRISGRSYRVTAAPLRRTPSSFIGVATPVATVVIEAPERRRPVPPTTLQTTYQLTRREVALTMALAEGQTLARVAERLGIQYETARTHLRRILSKTEVSRQSELLLLVERLASTVRFDTRP
jgi:DNA-binding CsgD family transcriptional regulator/PAS domain-containing protein